ncbi:MAG TPA: DUF72 domain-containing protein [Propionibacteriaceae bacterium]|nr:DUF72 domain-containing protein [Propionibacteriaceae bacterium]
MIRVGISGWTYPRWRKVFYPEGLAHRAELAYAARRVNSIEINGSFYSLQRPSSYRAWHAQTPDDFIFSVKGGRFITHMKKLAGVETALANFFASGVLGLENKLGPFLWQLPPTLGYDERRLAEFFVQLPRTAGQAAELAARHDAKIPDDRALTTAVDPSQQLRHCLEVRHSSFHDPGFVPLLRRHDIALVIADTAGRWPLIRAATADFVYIRLHGDTELYTSGYSSAALDQWAAEVRTWAQDHDVYVYFDNDVKVHAPRDAMALLSRLGIAPGP